MKKVSLLIPILALMISALLTSPIITTLSMEFVKPAAKRITARD